MAFFWAFMREFVASSSNPSESFEFAVRLGRIAALGDLIGLTGELGAGKTLFVKGVAEGFGIDAAHRVLSPTFSLINEYGSVRKLVHADLFRLSGPDEILETGLCDCIGDDALVLVEWFDRLEHRPGGWLEIEISISGESDRSFYVRSMGSRHALLAKEWLGQCQDRCPG